MNISITSIAGNNANTILHRMKNNIGGAKLDHRYQVKAPGEIKLYHPYIAAIPAYEPLPPHEKVKEMLKITLQNLPLSETTLIHTILPPKTCSRSAYINEILLKTYKMPLSFGYADQNISAQLQNLIQKLNNNHNSIIFGGIDCLTDPNTIQELSDEGRIMSNFGARGIVPSEAAVYLILKKNIIKAIASTIQQTLTQSNLTPDKINNIIISLGAEPGEPIEWFKITQTIWPFKKYPKLPEEITTYRTIGEIGAATLPMQLALATTLSGNNLIYEADVYSHHGAILIGENHG